MRRRMRGLPTECHPERKHKARGLCGPCYLRRLIANSPDMRRRRLDDNKQWRMNNAEGVLKKQLKPYGLTVESYNLMLARQNSLCAICKRPPSGPQGRLSVDHDHKTGNVRGLLCDKCNRGLGYFADSHASLISAAEYINDQR